MKLGFKTKELLTVLLLLLSPIYGQVQLPVAVERFVESQEQLVLDSAGNATEFHDRRIELIRNCECSRHSCGNDFPHAECIADLPTHEDVCGTSDNENGRLIDFQESVIRTPPGKDVNNLPASIKENICIYKHMEDVWRPHFIENNDTQWIFLGTRDGNQRRYPGCPRRRGEVNGDPRMNGCRFYDPRRRPWFISASTGPKDIVLVVDKSGSMVDHVDSRRQRTKWALTTDAVSSFMETFAFTDFVNIVTFSDTASPLWTETGLVRGQLDNLNFLRAKMSDEYPGGKTNFSAAFTTAFRLLTENCNVEPKRCSNCQKIIFFLTDGRDTSGADGESIRPSAMRTLIDDMQQRLINETGSRASIFTFSFTDQADDSIPRQIACANSGSWSFVSQQEENLLDALNSYFLYIASGRRSSKPVWLEPYLDATGLGRVTTVAVPFYAKNTNNDLDVFLGVIGHHILFSEFRKLGVSEDQALNLLIDRSENCVLSNDKPCESQIYRNAQDRRSLCADPYLVDLAPRNESAAGPLCYEHDDHFYRRFTEEISWQNAMERCRDDDGELASIETEDELAFVANVASSDGSWIGARDSVAETFSWLDPAVGNISTNSDFWGLGEPHLKRNVAHCVAIDTRGVIGILFAKPCSHDLSYICKYTTNTSCAGGIGSIPDRGYFKTPPLSKCIVTEEVLDKANPVVESAALKEKDIVCEFGDPKSNEEVLCCNSPADGTKLNVRSYFVMSLLLMSLVLFSITVA